MGRKARSNKMRDIMEADKTYIPPNDKTPSLMKQQMYDCSYCAHWGKVGEQYGCKRTGECEAEEEHYNALRIYGSRIIIDEDLATRKFYEHIHNVLNLHIRSR